MMSNDSSRKRVKQRVTKTHSNLKKRKNKPKRFLEMKSPHERQLIAQYI